MKREGFQICRGIEWSIDGFERSIEAIFLVHATRDFRSTIRFRWQKVYKRESIGDAVI